MNTNELVTHIIRDALAATKDIASTPSSKDGRTVRILRIRRGLAPGAPDNERFTPAHRLALLAQLVTSTQPRGSVGK